MRYITFILIFFSVFSFAQNRDFDAYFVNANMRIDYFHIGDATSDFIVIDAIYKQGIWAGSKINLIDKFNNGRNYVKVFDAKSNTLLYTKGFDAYFGEYQTTSEAKKLKKSYHETILIPYPKQKILFTIERRDKKNKLFRVFSKYIDPKDISIIREKLIQGVEVFHVVKNGPAHTKVDIAFLAEGYTLAEKKKFQRDVKFFTNIFLRNEPYKRYKNRFNIYGVFKASVDSGCDEPRKRTYKRTAMGVTFNSLGSARYLMTENNKAMRDIAAHVPYDALCIMVNHERYGGGGIYNLYCTFAARNSWKSYLLLHEFGHSFAGLADEYYTSNVAYSDFFPLGIEPIEPNITRLLDPLNVKWKKHVSKGVKIPIDWNKKHYDSMTTNFYTQYALLSREVEKAKKHKNSKLYKQKIKKQKQFYGEYRKKYGDFFKKHPHKATVGAFEGAGYASVGIYRPMLDCIMFSKGEKPYCKVCEERIREVIEFYSQ